MKNFEFINPAIIIFGEDKIIQKNKCFMGVHVFQKTKFTTK